MTPPDVPAARPTSLPPAVVLHSKGESARLGAGTRHGRV